MFCPTEHFVTTQIPVIEQHRLHQFAFRADPSREDLGFNLEDSGVVALLLELFQYLHGLLVKILTDRIKAQNTGF